MNELMRSPAEMNVNVSNDIKAYLSDKNDVLIQFRILWTDYNGDEQDDMFGYATWEDGKLVPEDDDEYSLDYIVKWELGVDMITVWEEAEVI